MAPRGNDAPVPAMFASWSWRRVRSAMVTDFLRNSGFDNAWNLAGGIDAWAGLVEPGVPRY